MQEGLKKHCPDLLVEFSLGNYAPTIEDRLACLQKRPDLASLCPGSTNHSSSHSTGSVNFKATRPLRARAFLNTHDEIDAMCEAMNNNNVKPNITIFDVSMIYNTNDLLRRGLLKLVSFSWMFLTLSATSLNVCCGRPHGPRSQKTLD